MQLFHNIQKFVGFFETSEIKFLNQGRKFMARWQNF